MAFRVLFDTNLFFSYLLSDRREPTAINTLFDSAFAMDFVPVAPLAVLDELLTTVTAKPFLAARISRSTIQRFCDSLYSFAEITPRRNLEIESLVRDRNDDYIVAYALEDQVDYLVSADKDLLVLADALAPLKIRNPRAFLDELSAGSAGPL